MSRRHLAVLAVGAAIALTPTLASAHSATAPHVVARGGHAAPAPKAAYRAVGPRATNGIDPSFTCTGSNARTFTCNATASTAPSGTTITGYTFDFGDGSAPTSNTTGTADYSYSAAGTYTVNLTVEDSAGDSASTSTSVTTLGSDYTAYGPTRVLDTRNGTGEGTPAPIASDSSLKLKIAGNGSIPANVTAVVVTLTEANETSIGDIIAYPDGTTRPATSNFGYSADSSVPTLATIAVGADGYIDLYNSSTGTADVIVDVSGYYVQATGSRYTPLTPARILDTRSSLGGHDGAVPDNGTVTLTIAGADSGALPSSGITAVALNLTATDGAGIGVITAYPAGGTLPSTSNIDYGHDQTIADYAIVPVGTDGKIVISNNNATGTVDLVADVSGYYSATGVNSYVPVTYTRSLDTRTIIDDHICPDCDANANALTTTINGATAYAITIAVTNTAAGGDATIYAAGSPLPSVSNLNWAAGQTVSNSDYAPASSTGIDVRNLSTGNADFIVDEYGYFSDN